LARLSLTVVRVVTTWLERLRRATVRLECRRRAIFLLVLVVSVTGRDFFCVRREEEMVAARALLATSSVDKINKTITNRTERFFMDTLLCYS
jgi:hypothetical protein